MWSPQRAIGGKLGLVSRLETGETWSSLSTLSYSAAWTERLPMRIPPGETVEHSPVQVEESMEQGRTVESFVAAAGGPRTPTKPTTAALPCIMLVTCQWPDSQASGLLRISNLSPSSRVLVLSFCLVCNRSRGNSATRTPSRDANIPTIAIQPAGSSGQGTPQGATPSFRSYSSVTSLPVVEQHPPLQSAMSCLKVL